MTYRGNKDCSYWRSVVQIACTVTYLPTFLYVLFISIRARGERMYTVRSRSISCRASYVRPPFRSKRDRFDSMFARASSQSSSPVPCDLLTSRVAFKEDFFLHPRRSSNERDRARTVSSNVPRVYVGISSATGRGWNFFANEKSRIVNERCIIFRSVHC